jgi:hypothetical protein
MSRIRANENLTPSSIENIDDEDSNLDVNIIIATFQEKLSSLMTELVIKEATIKQQSNIIRKLKGQNYE